MKLRSRRWAVRLLAVLLIAILLVACGGQSGPDATATAGASARDAVIAAYRAQNAQPAYQSRTAIVAGDSRADSLLEVQRPDRLRFVEGDRQLVVIGQEALLYENGQWVDAGGGGLAVAANVFDEQAGKAREDAIRSARLVGPAQFDGAPVKVYEYTLERTVEGVTVTSTTRLWVRDADGLPVKEEMEGRAGGSMTTLGVLFTYDPVSVEDPRGK